MSAASSWPVPTSPHLHRSFYSEFATAQVMFVPKWCVAVVLAWLVHVSSGLPVSYGIDGKLIIANRLIVTGDGRAR